MGSGDVAETELGGGAPEERGEEARRAAEVGMLAVLAAVEGIGVVVCACFVLVCFGFFCL